MSRQTESWAYQIWRSDDHAYARLNVQIDYVDRCDASKELLECIGRDDEQYLRNRLAKIVERTGDRTDATYYRQKWCGICARMHWQSHRQDDGTWHAEWYGLSVDESKWDRALFSMLTKIAKRIEDVGDNPLAVIGVLEQLRFASVAKVDTYDAMAPVDLDLTTLLAIPDDPSVVEYSLA